MQPSSLLSSECLSSLKNLTVVPEKNHRERKPNYPSQSDPGPPSSTTARLLWAHLGFLSVVFVQKSLDAGPIVRMDITEVLDLKPNEKNVNTTPAPSQAGPRRVWHSVYSVGEEGRRSTTVFNNPEQDVGDPGKPWHVPAVQPWISHSSELRCPLPTKGAT